MPTTKTIQASRKLRRRGLAPTTQASPFVREEIRHVRGGVHGARSPAQAIAIGLSKARRAGVSLPPRPAAPRTRRTIEVGGERYQVTRVGDRVTVRRGASLVGSGQWAETLQGPRIVDAREIPEDVVAAADVALRRTLRVRARRRPPSAATRRRESLAESRALRRESSRAASPLALSEHAHRAAGRRTARERSRSALEGAATRSPGQRRRAALQSARTRRRHEGEARRGARPSFAVRVGGRVVRDDFLTRAGAARHAAKVGGQVVERKTINR